MDCIEWYNSLPEPELNGMQQDVRPPSQPRRREEDRSQRSGGAPMRRRSSRQREFFRRFRQPLIGLGLVGAAVPATRALSPATTAEPAAGDEDAAVRASIATGDAEDNLVERIAERREDQERQQQVERAMLLYDITPDLAEDIYDIAREEGIDPRLAYGLVNTESTFREDAISPVGARGLTQLMPRTAAWLMPGTRTAELSDRDTNLRLGFRYLDQLIDKYKGNVRHALLAYNRGPGTVDKVLKRGGDPDNGYADKVLRG